MSARKRTSPRKPPAPSRERPAEPQRETAGESGFPVVGIGASAGGLDATSRLLSAVPADTGMAFVLVQHLDPTHESQLTEILSRATTMPVRQVTHGLRVEPNQVYVIPPGATMGVAGRVLELSPRSEPRGQQRVVDHFLRSLAADLGYRAIGVILSGTASDGTVGLEEIKAEGGITFAQDDSAQQPSMPRNAIAAGCVDFVLPPEGIAQELARIARHPYIAPTGPEPPGKVAGNELDRVLELLHEVTGVEFRHYKRSTLYRRVTRRLVLHKLAGLGEFVQMLRDDPGEVEALYQDILISVTTFFRNPDAFDLLKTKVFPALTEQRSRHEPVRVWALGCSTGEEAYSIAIAYVEFVEAAGRTVPLQVFATDLNGAGIEKARAGVYPKSIAQDVSPERLRRFFSEVDGSYRISKDIRDRCVFARHDALTDPPFSHIDLATCRNLLIYLDGDAQAKLLSLLHYAVRPGGYLWLGASETIGSRRELFESEADKFNVYVRKPGPARPGGFVIPPHPAARRVTAEKPEHEPHPPMVTPDPQREADRVLLSKYAPAAVLVSDDLEIRQFRGDTGPYLAPAPGTATLHLLKMLREGLVVAVRGAIQRARKEGAPIREEGVRVRSDTGYRDVNVEVIPVGRGPGERGAFLVLFEEVGSPAERRSRAARAKLAVPPPAAEGAEREVVRLRQELAATREYLQSTIEQQEVVNQELQSANEEVQSSNEELQSTNEELQTSKEEIESSNEELATLNDELQERNLELARSNNDFLNLLSSTSLAIVMLGPDLRIRRFTPPAEKVLNLITSDVGRLVSDVKLPVDVPNLEGILAEVVDAVTVRELEVQDREGHWYLLRVRPYRTLENKVDGAVLVLVDIDALKRDQESLRRQSDLLEQVHEPILAWQLENDGRITYWNRAAAELYGYAAEQALGQAGPELLKGSVPPQVYLDALARDEWWMGEITYTRSDGQPVEVESRMALVRPAAGPPVVIETNRPIGEMEQALRRQAETLLDADRNRNEFLLTLAHELRSPLTALRNAAMILGTAGAGIAAMERARELMRHQIQNMARLIDELTDVSRIARGEIRLEPVWTDGLTALRNAVEAMRPEMEARGQKLSAVLPEGRAELNGDPVRLEQMFGNLLTNAVKFTSQGGRIWVKAEIVPGRGPGANGPRLVVSLRDEGIGITAAALPRVFDLFMQADTAAQRAPGGLGIGLTLVRRIAEMHGGTVEAFSAGAERGSEFVVRLPLRESSAATG
jgi:two-component system, chemotaxis family, CheB/CheR fusion protein